MFMRRKRLTDEQVKEQLKRFKSARGASDDDDMPKPYDFTEQNLRDMERLGMTYKIMPNGTVMYMKKEG